jgi:hypothetical protein
MVQPVLRSEFPIQFCSLTVASCIGIQRRRMPFKLHHSHWFALAFPVLSLLTVVSCMSYYSALKMEARSPSETSVFICRTARYHIS